MADSDIKIELGSLVPHFIICALKTTPHRRRKEGKREKESLVRWLKEMIACLEGKF